MIVQPPSCATPADVDLRSTVSVAQSLSTIICNVSTSMQGSSFNVQSRVPMTYLQMRFALCMSRAEGLCTPLAHSLTQNWMSGRFVAMNINLPTIARYRLCSAGPSSGFSSGTLASDRTPGECTALQFSKPAQDNRLSKSLARGLTRNHRSVLINGLPRNFVSDPSCGQTRFQQEDLARGSPMFCPELHRDQPTHRRPCVCTS